MSNKPYPFQNRDLADMKGEQWDDIPYLDGAYQISNLGRIKALRRWVQRPRGGSWLREKIIAPSIGVQILKENKERCYRLAATIKCEGITYGISIARLVYFLFVKKFPLDDRRIFVTCKDGDPFNIRPSNLLLTTPSASISKAYRNQRRKLSSFGNKALPVTQYNRDGKKIACYPSTSAAEKATGISASHICDAVIRKDHLGSGYLWYKGTRKEDHIQIPALAKHKIKAEQFRNNIVTQYDRKGRKVREHPGILAAAKSVAVQQHQMKMAVTGESHTCRGHYWILGKGPKTIDVIPLQEKILEKRRKSVCRPVTQYDLQGNKIRTYRSQAEAADLLGLGPTAIFSALKYGNNSTSGGFIWRYGNGPLKIKVSATIRRKEFLSGLYENPVSQYDLRGRLVKIYPTLQQAASTNKFDRSQIVYAMTGRLLTYKHYYWRQGRGSHLIDKKEAELAEQRRLGKICKPVIQYNLNGKKLNEFPSMAAASKAQGISHTYIAQVANGKYEKAKGFIWKWKK